MNFLLINIYLQLSLIDSETLSLILKDFPLQGNEDGMSAKDGNSYFYYFFIIIIILPTDALGSRSRNQSLRCPMTLHVRIPRTLTATRTTHVRVSRPFHRSLLPERIRSYFGNHGNNPTFSSIAHTPSPLDWDPL